MAKTLKEDVAPDVEVIPDVVPEQPTTESTPVDDGGQPRPFMVQR